MRYFTRKLYQEFNSSDDEVADRADEAWEAALREYREHLDGIRHSMHGGVLKVAELNLHDAEVLSRVEEVQPFAINHGGVGGGGLVWSALAIVTVRMGHDLVSLIYNLWDHVRESPAPEDWQFSRLHEHWLYDEVDYASEQGGHLVHRVLFSTGVELEIPFASVVVHRFPAHAPGHPAANKQTA